ncbi:hypothetical protein ACIQOW_26735 [Kitasatospora sp. NPDC091335]|uniref:hypothetical protein n=1 Tax=Kitasatospora sp. NPDC091335 TaxID=3364085 RepID=UPI0037F1C26F
MSNEFLPGSAESGEDRAAVRALGDLAESVEIEAVPYDRLVAGGRRRLRRRRLLTAGLAAALVVGVAGGAAVIGERGRQAVSTVVVAASSPATTVAAPAAAAGAGASAADRDPFKPVRVKVAEGTASGHTWQAWAALWPTTSSKQDALKQAQLLREERYAANPEVKPVSRQDIDTNWDARLDQVNYYYTVDGRRQADDSVHAVSAPGGFPAAVGGASLGLHHPSAVPPVVIDGVNAEVTKVVIAWKTGGTTEAVPVVVGDSPFRYFAVGAKPGSDAATVTYYKADGSVELTKDYWLRTS